MSNRLFQGIIHQMKDAVDRVIGVIDENGVLTAGAETGSFTLKVTAAATEQYNEATKEVTVTVTKSEPPVEVGVTVSGTVTSWNKATSVKMYIYPTDMTFVEIRDDIKSDAPTGIPVELSDVETIGTNRYSQTFSVSGLEAGEYQVAVYKKTHALSVTALTVAEEDVPEYDVDLFLIGDVDGDGEVTVRDNTILSRKLASWADIDALIASIEAADIDQDGEVTVLDDLIIARMLANWGEEYNAYFE